MKQKFYKNINYLFEWIFMSIFLDLIPLIQLFYGYDAFLVFYLIGFFSVEVLIALILYRIIFAKVIITPEEIRDINKKIVIKVKEIKLLEKDYSARERWLNITDVNGKTIVIAYRKKLEKLISEYKEQIN